MKRTPNAFKAMTPAQLREFIDGCHRAGDYGGWFDAACKELNGRPASIAVPVTVGKETTTRTIEGKCLALPGYEAFPLVIHRSIEARGKYAITEETTGCSLCQDYERRTSHRDTVAALVAKFERFNMTPEKLRATIEAHRKRKGHK